MAKFVKPTDHDCEEHWVSIGTAAKHCGVPYQYIYGKVQRNSLPSHQELTSWGTKGKSMTCLKCAESFYGAKKASVGGDLLVEPIQAYRGWRFRATPTWRLSQDDTRTPYELISWYDETVWAKGGVQAKCNRGKYSDNCPCVRHRCGLYALNKPEAAIAYWPERATAGLVIGACDLWGRYVPGEDGYRAAQGKPTALLCDVWSNADIVHAVASCYEIPVVHSVKALGETIWGKEEYRGDWEGIGTGGSDAQAEANSEVRASASRAACREAAAGTSSIAGLKHLIHEGVISTSNVLELFEPPTEEINL